MGPISLDHLTVLGVTPPEMVDIAAELGFDALGPIVDVGAHPMPVTPLRQSHPLTREMAARLMATGVFVNNMDGFPLLPDSKPRMMRELLEVSAELGAKNAVTLIFDPETNRAFDHFCLLAEEARTVGLGLVLEFYALSLVSSLDAAVAWLARAAQPNARLLIDALHLNQSGGKPADIKRVDPALIAAAQLCDGPLQPTMEQYGYNAMHERGIPGTGELPLVEFLAALPPGVSIGLEVPMKSLADAGVPPKERARRCIEATRRLIDTAEAMR